MEKVIISVSYPIRLPQALYNWYQQEGMANDRDACYIMREALKDYMVRTDQARSTARKIINEKPRR